MKHGPDMNRISSTVLSWRRGLITLDEARRTFVWLLQKENFLPEIEQVPEPLPSDASAQIDFLKRIEQKLNLIIEHGGIPLPDEVNPNVLSADAIQLLKEQGKIAAIKLHRDRTGRRIGRGQNGLR